MKTMTTRSPMNLTNVNDTDTGIEMLGLSGLDTALLLLSGVESPRDRLPGS